MSTGLENIVIRNMGFGSERLGVKSWSQHCYRNVSLLPDLEDACMCFRVGATDSSPKEYVIMEPAHHRPSKNTNVLNPGYFPGHSFPSIPLRMNSVVSVWLYSNLLVLKSPCSLIGHEDSALVEVRAEEPSFK